MFGYFMPLLVQFFCLYHHSIQKYKKGQAVPVNAMKAHTGSRDKLYSFLPWHYTGREWSTSRPGWFITRKKFQYTLTRKLGPRVGLYAWRREKSLPPARIQTSHHPSHSPVTITTMQCRLHQSIQWPRRWDNEGNANVTGVRPSETDDYLKWKVVFQPITVIQSWNLQAVLVNFIYCY